MPWLKWECNDKTAQAFMRVDCLVAILTASAFTLIGPDIGYTGFCAQAKSVHQMCVLGRCVDIATGITFM